MTLSVLAIAAGCSVYAPTAQVAATARVASGPASRPSLPAGTGVDFWYALARTGAVTNDAATRALLSHLDDPAANEPYAARVTVLKSKGLLPAGFDAAPDRPMHRGDLAVALVKVLKTEKPLSAMVAGWNGRNATRALVFAGVYPESTENQGFGGAEFVGIIGAVDDRERGDPTDVPAEQIPGYKEPQYALDGPPVLDYHLLPLVMEAPMGDAPIYLMLQDGSTTQAGATTKGVAKKLRVFVTAVQGDQAEVKRTADGAWEKARAGMVLNEQAELRTGDKSSIRFNIPPGQTFTLDRLGACKVAECAFDGTKVKTTVGLEQGRVRMDVNETAPGSKAQIEKIDADAAHIAEAGVVHDTQIRSPNSALAVRGTRVSLLDQPPYAPSATSLTGRAEFLNEKRQLVAFGAVGARSQVQGSNATAADAIAARTVSQIPAASAASSFDSDQLNRVLATGGFLRGDVVVGNAGVDINSDFKNTGLAFVLQFGNPGDTKYQDLNLAVISPLSTATHLDYVANGPFTGSLNPNAPGYAAYRANNYPKTSPSGGAISRNAVSVPEALTTVNGVSSFRGVEAAFWPKTYPTGTYRIVVTNFIDAVGTPPGQGSDPVGYIVNVLVNGKSIGVLGGYNQTVGLYDSNVLNFNTSEISTGSLLTAKPTKPAKPAKTPKPSPTKSAAN
jgi:hypothetical protein